jgi:hypothetical protein
VIMLAWALWLALALLKWLSWGWSCFSDGGTWRKKVQPPEQQAKGSETERKHEEPGPAASPAPSVEKSPPDSTNEEIPPHKRSWFSRLRKKQQRPGAQ